MNIESMKIKNALKVLLLPIVVYIMFFILSGGTYGKSSSIIMNLKQTLAPTLISLAICSNLLSGRMDLSAGSVVMLASMFGAKLVYIYDIGVVTFALVVVVAGLVLGTISGIAYMLLKVPAIVTSLGVCMVYETLSNLTSISWVTPISGDTTMFGRFPYNTIVFFIMFILFYIIYNYTKFGYDIKACASSQQIAKTNGVNTKKTALLSYVISGLFLGVAALLRISIQGSIDTPMYMSSINIIFDSMLGIYIGMALQRYCNLVIGIFVGNFVMNMITTGLLSLGLSASLQSLANGVFLLIIMVYTYNHARVTDYYNMRKELKILEQQTNL